MLFAYLFLNINFKSEIFSFIGLLDNLCIFTPLKILLKFHKFAENCPNNMIILCAKSKELLYYIEVLQLL